MKAGKVSFSYPVTLVGGGALDLAMLEAARVVAPALVAADGAADRLDRLGFLPDAVIGDMDSIGDPAAWAGRTRLVHLSEQDTTDFEKCLYATEAPLYVAAGFTGRRVDHMLAVFHAMLRRADKRVVLLGEEEVMALVPPDRPFAMALDPGAVVSFYPLRPARGVLSEGLEWPIDGLSMAAGAVIGTSNLAVAHEVKVAFDAPGVLVMVARKYLGALIEAVG